MRKGFKGSLRCKKYSSQHFPHRQLIIPNPTTLQPPIHPPKRQNNQNNSLLTTIPSPKSITILSPKFPPGHRPKTFITSRFPLVFPIPLFPSTVEDISHFDPTAVLNNIFLILLFFVPLAGARSWSLGGNRILLAGSGPRRVYGGLVGRFVNMWRVFEARNRISQIVFGGICRLRLVRACLGIG